MKTITRYYMVYDMKDNIVCYCDSADELQDFLGIGKRQMQYTLSKIKKGKQNSIISEGKHYRIFGYKEKIS